MTSTVSFVLFCLTLVTAPLAFGTVETWSVLLVEALIFLAAAIFFSDRLRNHCTCLKIPGTIPLLLLLAWMAIQLIPLPPSLLKILSPAAYRIYSDTVGSVAPQRWLPMSIHLEATFDALLRQAAVTVAYFLTIYLMVHRSRQYRLITLLLIFVASIGFEAIIQRYLSREHIYWFRATNTPPGYSMGPWFCRNHFAGYMEMLIPMSVGLFIMYRPRFRYAMSLRERIVEMVAVPSAYLHLLLLAVAVIGMVSVFLSLSRGGIASLTLSMLVLGALLSWKHPEKRRKPVVTWIVLLVILGVTWFGWQPIISRFDSTFTVDGDISNDRFNVWQDSLGIIRDFPLTGSGFGTYIDSFKAYSTIPRNTLYDHAHNDYIELLSDGGLVSFCLAACFVIGVIFTVFRCLSRRRDSWPVYMGCAALAGIVAILAHSIVDFNMHIFSNRLTFFVLCGIAVSTSHDDSRRRSQLPTHLAIVPCRWQRYAVIPMILMFIVACRFHFGVLSADAIFASVARVYLTPLISKSRLEEVASVTRTAWKYDPLSAQYPFSLARAETFLGKQQGAVENYTAAMFREPMACDFTQFFGLYYQGIDPVAADRLLEASVNYDRTSPSCYQRYATYLMGRGQRDMAIGALERAMAMEADKMNDYAAIAGIMKLGHDEFLRLLPERVGPYLGYARLLEKRGDEQEAEAIHRRALDLIGREPAPLAWHYNGLYSLLMKQKRFDDALELLNQAVKRIPTDPGLHLKLADLYRRVGITYRAQEEEALARTLKR